jgi:pentatricopeptide repeat protein
MHRLDFYYQQKNMAEMYKSGCTGSYLAMKMKEPLIAARFYQVIADNMFEAGMWEDSLRVYQKMLHAAYGAKTFAWEIKIHALKKTVQGEMKLQRYV